MAPTPPRKPRAELLYCAGTCARTKKVCRYGPKGRKKCYRCFLRERLALCTVCGEDHPCPYAGGTCWTCYHRERELRACADCPEDYTTCQKYRGRKREQKRKRKKTKKGTTGAGGA